MSFPVLRCLFALIFALVLAPDHASGRLLGRGCGVRRSIDKKRKTNRAAGAAPGGRSNTSGAAVVPSRSQQPASARPRPAPRASQPARPSALAAAGAEVDDPIEEWTSSPSVAKAAAKAPAAKAAATTSFSLFTRNAPPTSFSLFTRTSVASSTAATAATTQNAGAKTGPATAAASAAGHQQTAPAAPYSLSAAVANCSSAVVANCSSAATSLVSCLLPNQLPVTTTYFYRGIENSPRNDVTFRRMLADTILAANTTLDIAAYLLTDREVRNAIRQAATKKVKVRILYDEHEERRPSPYRTEVLRDLATPPPSPRPAGTAAARTADGAGARPTSAPPPPSRETETAPRGRSRSRSPPRPANRGTITSSFLGGRPSREVDQPPRIELRHNGNFVPGQDWAVFRMHHKFVIIDRKWVLTGSFNPTVTAHLRNLENAVLIRNGDCAREYLAEFEDLWQRYRDNHYGSGLPAGFGRGANIGAGTSIGPVRTGGGASVPGGSNISPQQGQGAARRW